MGDEPPRSTRNGPGLEGWAAGPGPRRPARVLAGPSTRLPEPGLLFHSPIRHEKVAALRPGEGVEYQACFEVERIDPEVFAHLCDEMALDAQRDRLFHRFADANRMAPSA